ncbi:MAG: DUF1998 domain-containing protein [Coleofasciculus sp. C1-SOL-03]|uniref:DrmB family protein n=1 Tax=Coleofasciculus sp. C1-SOL-03 TaxID=3069522 RepID=UPI0032FDF1D6
MPKGPIRRAQLIAPYGVGAMIVVRDGTSLITAGLDHWYERENGRDDVDLSEFRVEEWRLAQQLGVDHFRLPPDFRIIKGESVPNAYLTVPFLRFPQWHYCQSCGHLKELKLSQRSKEKCPKCEEKKRNRYLVQVPIVAMCDHCHIQDFPWREWVHRSDNPTCKKPMRLVGTGSATLGGLSVQCECGEKRSLSRITETEQANNGNDTTFLSKYLNKKPDDDSDRQEFLCQGKRPWFGTEESEPCSRPLRGSLRSASNVYYSQVRSAIYLKRGNDSELISILEEPPISTLIEPLAKANVDLITPDFLRGQHPQLLQPFSNEDIKVALNTILSEEDNNSDEIFVEGDDPETHFRRPEFNVLRTERDEKQLKIRKIDLNEYDPDIAQYFSQIMLVDKLRETRALTGFTRIFPENEQNINSLQVLLRRHPLPPQDSWLPAYVVYGEGIFLEFNERRLQQWLIQNGDAVQQRIQPLVQRYQQVQERRHLRDRPLTPRFILLHTFAHLLMNRLTFECGYSSAALRERLYISDNRDAPMAGVLIYTAAGDSEGTMGGLVRMGKPDYFKPMFHAALEDAKWCSADPVCMEIGARGGQGPDSCNLAACHNCSLVPETACEEFNRFLDRGVVVGDINNRSLGFFT